MSTWRTRIIASIQRLPPLATTITLPLPSEVASLEQLIHLIESELCSTFGHIFGGSRPVVTGIRGVWDLGAAERAKPGDPMVEEKVENDDWNIQNVLWRVRYSRGAGRLEVLAELK